MVELKLGSEQLLRVMSYKLLALGYPQPALHALEEVTRLKPEEPQSWRDFGMALARNGRYEEAVRQYYRVAIGEWDERFEGIEVIAVEEMNALIATCGLKLDLSWINVRLLRNLPVDLRVELCWDSDNTDMDLQVIDPEGEECHYLNRLTYLGARHLPDFTEAYGPEVIKLKRAPKGTYTINVKYYSNSQQNLAAAPSCIVRIYTQYGRENGTMREVMLRLKKPGDFIHVGEVVI